jgi:hypothetical protein
MAQPPDHSPRRTTAVRVAEHVFFGVGAGIASTVYGTVLVMATLTAAYATEKHPWKLAVIIATTRSVLWIAHLYAHGLSASIEQSRRLSRAELVAILRRELGILLAAAAPTIALLLGASGVFAETAAVWLALAIGLVTLAVEGLRFALKVEVAHGRVDHKPDGPAQRSVKTSNSPASTRSSRPVRQPRALSRTSGEGFVR